MIIELYMHWTQIFPSQFKGLRTGIKYCFPRFLAKSDTNEKSLGMNGSYPEKESQGNKEHLYADPLPNYKTDQRLLININPLHTLFIYKFNGFYSKLPFHYNEAPVSAVLNHVRIIWSILRSEVLWRA